MRTAVAWILALGLSAPVLAAAVPAPARADGDPASDELIGANVFYPFSPPVAAGLQKSLNTETAAASRLHFPIKVALIASPADLGAIPSLFAKPQQYADFLDQEISFAGAKQPLLVVMPDGYGVQGFTRPASLAAATLAKPSGRQSDELAQAAIVAVSKLATAAGHRIDGVPGIPAAGTGGGAGGGGATVLSIAALAFLAVVTAAAVLWFRRRRAQIP
jgi:hypothetical protein